MKEPTCRHWLDDGAGGGCGNQPHKAIVHCGGSPSAHCYEAPLSTKASRYLRRLVKDDVKGRVSKDVDYELQSHGVTVQVESIRHGHIWETFSYIMKGQEKAEALVRPEKKRDRDRDNIRE